MKLAILSATLGVCGAFTSQPMTTARTAALRMSDEVADAAPVVPAVLPINGWVADASKPCYGLPGAISPLGYFDPLGFAKDTDLGTVKRLREAEVMHGRVSMMAVIGYLIGECKC
jgi:hypothetical protein